jgi:cathepsin B
MVHDLSTLDLPANHDASEAYPKCSTIGTIYNQADCGSCWAFGCVEAVQDRFCIQSNQTVSVSLSFNDEVTCGPDDGCEGGDAGDAWEYVAESGLVTSACDPYTIPTCPPEDQPCLNFTTTPNCTQQCVDSEQWSKSKHFLSTSYGVSSNEAQIRAEIFKNGPVEACFDVYADFVTYKSGVYQYETGDYLGGHCIKMIGWGTENGTPYWLCNNSWTVSWGDNGQFKILRGSDECGIEDDVVGGVPALF